MKIKRIRTIKHPSVYSYLPTHVLQLEIENHDEQDFSKNSDHISLLKKNCGAATPDKGQIREIRTAENSLAQAVKNVACGLIKLAGFGASGGVVRFSGDAGIYEIAVEFQTEEATRFLLETAAAAVSAALKKQNYFIDEAITEARKIAARNEPAPLPRAIEKAAKDRAIPCSSSSSGEDSIIQLGYGKNLRRLRAGESAGKIEMLSLPDSIPPDILQTDDAEKFGEKVIETLYPSGKNARIPIVAITGTNGKTTVTRLTAHVLRESGLNIGTTTTDGILFNGEIIEKGDTTGPASAQMVLSNEQVDIAVLETARGGILRRGLGWDRAEIAVITNITEDHIGQDGIESVADLVDIKSLIAERVTENGMLILNADDAESAALINRPAVKLIKKKIVFFGMSVSNSLIEKHAENGETVYFANDGWICERTGTKVTPIADTLKIPIAMNGTADFQIQNALAATAAARALNLMPEQIAAGLYSFQNTIHNPGRNNFYRVGKGYALIDYGHNPKALEAICRMTSRWQDKTITGIISFPGDRRDDVIEAAGRIAAAGFDQIIVKGDINLRGRESGEVAQMLCRLVLEAGNQNECQIVLDAAQAFEDAISEIKENEVIVFFYEKLAPVLATLGKYGAVAANEF